MTPSYLIQITAKMGDGCEAELVYELEDEPQPGDVANVLCMALDPDETNLIQFIGTEHARGGHEKIQLTAQVKVK
jgi:hypothetical protein